MSPIIVVPLSMILTVHLTVSSGIFRLLDLLRGRFCVRQRWTITRLSDQFDKSERSFCGVQ